MGHRGRVKACPRRPFYWLKIDTSVSVIKIWTNKLKYFFGGALHEYTLDLTSVLESSFSVNNPGANIHPSGICHRRVAEQIDSRQHCNKRGCQWVCNTILRNPRNNSQNNIRNLGPRDCQKFKAYETNRVVWLRSGSSGNDVVFLNVALLL